MKRGIELEMNAQPDMFDAVISSRSLIGLTHEVMTSRVGKPKAMMLALTLFLLAGCHVTAQQLVILDSGSERMNIGGMGSFFVDPTGELTFEQILDASVQAQFQPMQAEVPNFGTSNATVWYKFVMMDRSLTEWVLAVGNPYLDSVHVFLQHGDRIVRKETGRTIPMRKRDIEGLDFLVRLALQRDSTATVYVRVKSFINYSPFTIGTVQSILEEQGRNSTFLGVYFGIFVITFLVNLFIFLYLKESDFLYYCGWILGLSLYIAINKGVLALLLPDDLAWLMDYGTPALSLGSTFVLLFSNSFLKAKQQLPRLYQINGIGIVLTLMVTIGYILGFRVTASTTLQFVAVVFSSIQIGYAWKAYRRGYRPARFFLISLAFSLGSIIVYALFLRGIMPYSFFSSNAFILGAMWELIFLSLALADKLNTMKEERAEAQQKSLEYATENQRLIQEQNVLLEKRVDDRTRELQETIRTLKTTQQQLIHSEKMASLGQLTAGVAHEIKNPLNFVNNFADVSKDIVTELEEELAGNDTAALSIQLLKENLGKIAEHGKRADGIVRNMMEHATHKTGSKEAVSINALVDSAVRRIYHTHRVSNPDIPLNIEKELDESIPEIHAAPNDLMRVFVNILDNAIDASTARMHRVVQSGDGRSFMPTVFVISAQDGECIEVRIRDNGDGIPQDIVPKIFDPFFTTKASGEGTGLGLSISYEIIAHQHDGTLTVESSNEGAEFIIRLPI